MTIIEELADEIKDTAWWRLEKADQYSNDSRNAEAAASCSKIGAELRILGETPERERFVALHEFIFSEGVDGDEG